MQKLMTPLPQHPSVVWPLRIAALLWLVWGLVHAIAGIATILGDPPGNIQAIADAVPPANLALAYPDAVGAILNPRGFNLFCFGAVTVACAVCIRQRRALAVDLAALVGELADLGYSLFPDLGGYVDFERGIRRSGPDQCGSAWRSAALLCADQRGRTRDAKAFGTPPAGERSEGSIDRYSNRIPDGESVVAALEIHRKDRLNVLLAEHSVRRDVERRSRRSRQQGNAAAEFVRVPVRADCGADWRVRWSESL